MTLMIIVNDEAFNQTGGTTGIGSGNLRLQEDVPDRRPGRAEYSGRPGILR